MCASCADPSELELCLKGAPAHPLTDGHCELAWQHDHNIDAAVTASMNALVAPNDAALARWTSRAPETIKGARIFHFAAQRRSRLGDEAGAEKLFRHALAIRVNRDPARATNTAVALLDLVRSYEPASESVELARVAWEQAELSGATLARSMAADYAIDLLLDFGQIDTAEALLNAMKSGPNAEQVIHDIADGRIQAAHGRYALATAILSRALQDGERFYESSGMIELIDALIAGHHVDAANEALKHAREVASRHSTSSFDANCRLDAASADVQLAWGHADVALEIVEAGLHMPCRDRAREELLEVKGEVLTRLARPRDAELTWHEAADLLEAWRTSLPASRLRTGVIARHRRVLEMWLDSAGARGDVATVVEIADRLFGHRLLDAVVDREMHSSHDAGALFADTLDRLDERRDLAPKLDARWRLEDARPDFTVLLEGAEAVWALRHAGGHWTLRDVGPRTNVLAISDAFRRNPDDATNAAAVGSAFFPGTADRSGEPLTLLLDQDFADLPIAAVRVHDRYLVESAPIVELLSPSELFAEIPQHTWQAPVVLANARDDLAGAEREAVAVAQDLGVVARLRGDATRAALLDSPQPRILHLALHSIVEGHRESLVLADGSVSAVELVHAGIAPMLAVVATCRSENGEDPESSLVAALLANGTPGVIGSKRALDDSETGALLRDFYREGGATDPIRALAAAQRRAISRGTAAHVWAAISFFGTPNWKAPKQEGTRR